MPIETGISWRQVIRVVSVKYTSHIHDILTGFYLFLLTETINHRREGRKVSTYWVKKGDLLGIVQTTEFWWYRCMVNAQTRICTPRTRHKILWDLEIKRDHPIEARKLDLDLVNKKSRPLNKIKGKEKKGGWIPGHCQRTKRNPSSMEHDGDSDINHSQSTRNYTKDPLKETVQTGNPRKDWDDPNHRTDEIG